MSEKRIDYLAALPAWLRWAERYWTDLGAGRGRWGATHNKALGRSGHGGYLSACALLACEADTTGDQTGLSRDEMISRALKCFRHIFASHVCRGEPAADETAWGHHWGSPVLLERTTNFVDLLEPYMAQADRELRREVIVSEAEHHLATPIETNRFPADGETHMERNYWRGSALYRAAQVAPDHPNAAPWLEKARGYWINSVSVPADGALGTVVDGKPCQERFVGANLHPEFVFEHHGAASTDYTMHTQAFLVMIMLSVLRHGWTPSEAMFHHMVDLWNVARRFILPNGRMAFVGGAKRPRYAITQNYLLPITLFWSRFGGDAGVEHIPEAVLAIQSQDREASGDGSFYTARAQWIREQPMDVARYFWRMGADAIYSLGMAHLLSKLPARNVVAAPTAGEPAFADEDLKRPIFCRDAGLVFRRTDHGFFSVYWGRSDTAEEDPPLALAIPLANPDRADWLTNLATVFQPFGPDRKLADWRFESFPNGFATAGRILEGDPEDKGAYPIDQRLAFVLFPDGRSFLRIEKATARAPIRVSEIAALNLNLANDIFTGNEFTLSSTGGAQRIRGKGGAEGLQEIAGPWVNIEDELGVIALYGPEAFTLECFSERLRGFNTLLAERLCYPLVREPRTFEKGETILDTAVLLIANISAQETREKAAAMDFARSTDAGVEIILLRLDKERSAMVAVNLSGSVREIELPPLKRFGTVDAVTRAEPIAAAHRATLAPWETMIFLCR